MSDDRCPQCGGYSFGGRRCISCSEHDRLIREGIASNARAAWAIATAQERAADAQARIEDAQRTEIERRRRTEWLATFVDLPQVVESGLPAARSVSDTLLVLTKIANVIGGMTPDDWAAVHRLHPVESELIFDRLRDAVVPTLQSLWSRKSSLQSSAEGLLRSLASALAFDSFQRLLRFHEIRHVLDCRVANLRQQIEAQKEELSRELTAWSNWYDECLKEQQKFQEFQVLRWEAIVLVLITGLILLTFFLLGMMKVAHVVTPDSAFCFFFGGFAGPPIALVFGIRELVVGGRLKQKLYNASQSIAEAEATAAKRIPRLDRQLRKLDSDYDDRVRRLTAKMMDPAMRTIASGLSM